MLDNVSKDEFLKQLGITIRKLRTYQNKTSVEISHYSEVSQSTISEIENYSRAAQVDTLFKLSSALNLRLDFLFNLVYEDIKESDKSTYAVMLNELLPSLNNDQLKTLIAIAKKFNSETD